MEWSQINDTMFEEIACAYANDVYSEYTWIPTGKSWDGNKDAFFRDKIENLNYYYKGWCEAKYTKDASTSIPKSHMDSTLISGILDGEVIFILFVTNGRITLDFIQRATAILQPHKIKIKFVEGMVLTNWLKDNPKILEKYFNQTLPDKVSTKLEINIIDICFLNAIMSAPSLITQLSTLKVNNEYFLYLNIYSNQKASFYIELDSNALKVMQQKDMAYKVVPGYNSFLIKYLAKYPYKGRVQISLAEDDEILFCKCFDIVIEEDDILSLTYSYQEQYIQEIYTCIKSDITKNIVLQISGHEGSGKTYLLRKVLSNIADCIEVLNICVSEKEAENASSICKLILFINFGFLYDLSDDAFNMLIKNYSNFPFEIYLELREGTKNQITALNVIDKISLLLEKTPCALFPNINFAVHRNLTYIFIDDFQKISKRHQNICKSILEEFVIRDYSQFIIIGNRPEEFKIPSLEKTIQNIRSGHWHLPGISFPDVYNSLVLNFSDEVAELAKLFPLPISVLHLELLIRQLKKKNICRNISDKKGIVFSEAYQETNINNSQFAVNKIRNCKYLEILYVVYKIESGVPVKLLHSFFGCKYDKAYTNFDNDMLLKEDEEKLKPYHDIYLYAFDQINFNSTYMDILNQFLQFCINEKIEDPILLSNILAILIEKKNILRQKYLSLAFEICSDYYAKSHYIAAQNLALVLMPPLDTTPYNQFKYKDLELLYIYAQSEKYSKTHVGSSKYLKMIADIGNIISLNSSEKGIVHEVHSELITNYLYALDFNNFEKELLYFDKNLKNKVNLKSSEHKVNAYLNFLNRKILYSFFTNSNDITECYEIAKNESMNLKRDDYKAYADMDFGKILISNNPIKAIGLLKNSLPIFEKYKKCEKRRIDCLAEIAFLNTLVNHANFDELYNLQKEAYEKKYVHVYARITIILLTLELIEYGEPDEIEIKIEKLLIEYSDLKESNRLAFFTNQLLSAVYFKKEDYQKQCKYIKRQLKVADKFSKTYMMIPSHNINCDSSTSIAWFFENQAMDENCFWMDPKIW